MSDPLRAALDNFTDVVRDGWSGAVLDDARETLIRAADTARPGLDVEALAEAMKSRNGEEAESVEGYWDGYYEAEARILAAEYDAILHARLTEKRP